MISNTHKLWLPRYNVISDAGSQKKLNVSYLLAEILLHGLSLEVESNLKEWMDITSYQKVDARSVSRGEEG